MSYTLFDVVLLIRVARGTLADLSSVFWSSIRLKFRRVWCARGSDARDSMLILLSLFVWPTTGHWGVLGVGSASMFRRRACGGLVETEVLLTIRYCRNDRNQCFTNNQLL